MTEFNDPHERVLDCDCRECALATRDAALKKLGELCAACMPIGYPVVSKSGAVAVEKMQTVLVNARSFLDGIDR